MARNTGVRLSDFEADDQAFLQPKAPTLLEFAKSHGLRVTSGFSHGGHNKGSRHYQGSESDPGAIDIDHRNVDYNKLLSWAGQNGYTVLDERSRPAGQRVWGGPHYHLQKGGKPTQRPVAKRRELPAPQQAAPIQVGQTDLTMPVSTDAYGNLVFNQQTPSKVDLSKATKPVQQKQAGGAVSLGDFELTPDELAEVKTVADRFKPQPQAQAKPQPKDPNFIEGVGNLLNAGGKMLQQIPGAFQKEYQSLQGSNPLSNQQELMGAATVGALSTPTDLINLATQAPAAIGNAWAGQNKYKPLFPEVYGARDIPGLKQIVERHPVADFIGGAAVPVEGALGALAKGKLGRAAKVAGKTELPTPAGPVVKNYNVPDPMPQPKLPDDHKPYYGFVNRNSELIESPHQVNPENVMRPQQTKPGATRELSEAFAERQRPTEAPQIIDPRKAPIPDELGAIKTEELPSGLIVATRSGEIAQKPAVDLQIERGLGVGRELTPANSIDPLTGQPYDLPSGKSAQDSASVFDTAGRKIYAADAQNKEALNRYQGSVETVKKMGESDDLATAQRNIGARINELEQKPSLSDAEYRELTSKVDTLDELLNNRKTAVQAEQQLAQSQKVNSRGGLPEPAPQLSRLQKAQEAPVIRDIESVLKSEPSPAPKTSVEPVARELGNTREVGAVKPEILDATGKPIGGKNGIIRELEIPGQSKPSNVQLEVPKRFEPTVRELEIPGKPKPDNAPASNRLDPTVRELPTAEAQKAPQGKADGNVFRTPEGGEVYTHGRDVADVQRQLEGVKGQIAAIADIERHLQAHNPEAVGAIRNILNAGKNSEAVKFSYIAREAPGEAARVRDNFIPTHFTYESIKPATQRTYLRNKFGSDDAVISHLKQEIINKGGAVDAAMLQTKGGGSVKPATQINRLINALDAQTGGAYLKSPRVHGINMGETTRSAAGDRGIRLDTIQDSSLTGQKVTPEQLSGLAYNNQIAPTLKALDELASSGTSPVFKRAVNQIQKGEINPSTVRKLKAALADKDLAAQFCNILGVKP